MLWHPRGPSHRLRPSPGHRPEPRVGSAPASGSSRVLTCVSSGHRVGAGRLVAAERSANSAQGLECAAVRVPQPRSRLRRVYGDLHAVLPGQLVGCVPDFACPERRDVMRCWRHQRASSPTEWAGGPSSRPTTPYSRSCTRVLRWPIKRVRRRQAVPDLQSVLRPDRGRRSRALITDLVPTSLRATAVIRPTLVRPHDTA